MNLPFTLESKPMICKKHGFPVQDICLYGSPMNGRVLCRICKQNLSREQLLEVISLTDFLSGNFLIAIDSMIKPPQEDSLEKHIDAFYQKLENTMVALIRNSKENALKSAGVSASADLEHQRGLVKTKHGVIGKNWQVNIHDSDMLNDLAKNFAELSENLTILMSQNPTFNENLKFDDKMVTDFEKMCEKYLDEIVPKLNSAAREETLIDIEEETKEKEPSRQNVSRNKKRIQDLIDNEENEAEKKKKKIKPSLDEVVEIDEEEAKADSIPKVTCIHKILTKHRSLPWGGLCYIPSKKHLVSGGFEGSIYVWDIETKASVFSTTTNSRIYKLLYIENKEILLVSTDIGLVHIFDVKRGYTLVFSYQAHPKQAFSMAYLSKVDLIGSCGEEGNIALWSFNQETNECSLKRILDTNKKQVSCLCYIEDQNLLVAGLCKGGHIMVFQPEKSKSFRVMKAHNKEKSVDSLVYVPEWKKLISGSEDSYIKFWDFSDLSNPNGPNSLKAIRRDDSYIEAIVVMPEENYLFHTNLDECFSVWDLSKEKLVENIHGHSNEERGEALIYIKERKVLITAFAEEIRFWKVEFN